MKHLTDGRKVRVGMPTKRTMRLLYTTHGFMHTPETRNVATGEHNRLVQKIQTHAAQEALGEYLRLVVDAFRDLMMVH